MLPQYDDIPRLRQRVSRVLPRMDAGHFFTCLIARSLLKQLQKPRHI
ncbi:hypothetical protein XM75_u0089 [Vibrio vulnificus]|nr:hypothetical protein XM75_u0089 [Vibrio vulnificus]